LWFERQQAFRPFLHFSRLMFFWQSPDGCNKPRNYILGVEVGEPNLESQTLGRASQFLAGSCKLGA
jgi:hypothetical protein